MFDHRLAQVTHQEYVNDAAAKRRKKAAGHNSKSIGIQKLLATVTTILSLFTMKS